MGLTVKICGSLAVIGVYPVAISETVKWRQFKDAIVVAEDMDFLEFEYCVRRLRAVVVVNRIASFPGPVRLVLH